MIHFRQPLTLFDGRATLDDSQFQSMAQSPLTLMGLMHQIVGLPGLLASPLAPIFVWRRLRNDSQWMGYQTFSLLSGIGQIVGFFSLLLLISSGFAGVGIRILLVIQLAWPMVLAIRLLRLSLRSIGSNISNPAITNLGS